MDERQARRLRAEVERQARKSLLAAVELLDRGQLSQAVGSARVALLLMTGSMPAQIGGDEPSRGQ